MRCGGIYRSRKKRTTFAATIEAPAPKVPIAAKSVGARDDNVPKKR